MSGDEGVVEMVVVDVGVDVGDVGVVVVDVGDDVGDVGVDVGDVVVVDVCGAIVYGCIL